LQLLGNKLPRINLVLGEDELGTGSKKLFSERHMIVQVIISAGLK
jgi:hypothetical protein